ncbi:type III pantothenate kinase [Vogesella indigofera]|uniref:Type III pantothenate kinase n=1 Tax=Vogesella indigofera TaxID=45465 RepID=A0A495AWW5_VOGIN|nr:type III pantothenate kinase [Vogesella indigofera]RKQ53226.1 type III pantothenate kinase [Vogesella indigofera]
MKLLIDAGNTRVKWALWDGRQLQQQGAVAHADIASLAAPWAALPLSAVLAASVAHAAVRQAIEAASPLPVQWQRAQATALGVRNHYRNVAEQGADRWLAVLGARQRYPAQDVVIASAGTALTVEALTAEGDYLGGLILPGYRLMLASLAQNTANLDRAAGLACAFPQGTEDALASGTIDALCGAIQRLQQRLAAHTGRSPLLLLTGGDAALLQPHLPPDTRMVDNLVIYGLASVADGS